MRRAASTCSRISYGMKLSGLQQEASRAGAADSAAQCSQWLGEMRSESRFVRGDWRGERRRWTPPGTLTWVRSGFGFRYG